MSVHEGFSVVIRRDLWSRWVFSLRKRVKRWWMMRVERMKMINWNVY